MSYAGKIEELIAERDAIRAQANDDKRELDQVREYAAALNARCVADAERYRWLRSDFSVMGANIDGQHSWAYRRNFSLRGPTLDAAIDTAMGAAPRIGAA